MPKNYSHPPEKDCGTEKKELTVQISQEEMERPMLTKE